MAQREGWGTIRPGETVAHYYRTGTSRCHDVIGYRGPLEPNGWDAEAGPNDCHRCRRSVEKEKAKHEAYVRKIIRRRERRSSVGGDMYVVELEEDAA